MQAITNVVECYCTSGLGSRPSYPRRSRKDPCIKNCLSEVSILTCLLDFGWQIFDPCQSTAASASLTRYLHDGMGAAARK